MTLPLHVRAIALASLCLGCAVPAAIAAPAPRDSGPSGGAGLGPGPTTTSASPPVAATQPLGGPVSADGNGFTLDTRAAGTFRRILTFTGTVPARDHGDDLSLESEWRNGSWHDVADATVASNGSFRVGWHANRSGIVAFRASLLPPAGTATAAASAPAATSPPLTVTIYRNAIATIYGPGFYGHKTACGLTLAPSTLGVASRTLRCGTKVSIAYRGRTIEVPVIDRGPYSNGASWDLTEATAKSLGDLETETVGAAIL